MNHEDTEIAGQALRSTWEFPFPAAAVAHAAERQRAYHQGRVAWWTRAARQAEQALKKKGFEYRERELTGGSRLEVVGDPELIKRITEAKQKIRHHREQIVVFLAWKRALRTVAKRTNQQALMLTMDDILYFSL